jgi:hypothetical protein
LQEISLHGHGAIVESDENWRERDRVGIIKLRFLHGHESVVALMRMERERERERDGGDRQAQISASS